MQWKSSNLFPDYEVSECGDLRRSKPDSLGRILATTLKFRIDRGYKKYRAYRDGKSFHVKASQLVADAFICPKPFDGAEVCHDDGNKANDHFSNLRWDTHKGNHADTLVHGTRSRGERHGQAKLTECQVVEIRRLSLVGISQETIAAQFDVSRRTVSDAASGKTWAHVSA